MNEHQHILEHNRAAWNQAVDSGGEWTRPVSVEVVEAARRGEWHIVLTPVKHVPRSWFGTLEGARVLCLASGGGQQAPVLAAAGAHVTVFDNSPRQLAQDRFVADRDGLEIQIVQGDMADLSAFADESFDLIVHPVSNCFAPDVRPVWKESFRVLAPGGALLAGFNNPSLYIFDPQLEDKGILEVRYSLPYSDLQHPEQQRYKLDNNEPLEFGHSLDDQIGGQLDAGFLLAGFYEDSWHIDRPTSRHFPPFIATRAIKPTRG